MWSSALDRQLWCSSTILYNTTSIACNHHTNIYLLLNMYMPGAGENLETGGSNSITSNSSTPNTSNTNSTSNSSIPNTSNSSTSNTSNTSSTSNSSTSKSKSANNGEEKSDGQCDMSLGADAGVGAGAGAVLRELLLDSLVSMDMTAGGGSIRGGGLPILKVMRVLVRSSGGVEVEKEGQDLDQLNRICAGKSKSIISFFGILCLMNLLA